MVLWLDNGRELDNGAAMLDMEDTSVGEFNMALTGKEMADFEVGDDAFRGEALEADVDVTQEAREDDFVCVTSSLLLVEESGDAGRSEDEA